MHVSGERRIKEKTVIITAKPIENCTNCNECTHQNDLNCIVSIQCPYKSVHIGTLEDEIVDSCCCVQAFVVVSFFLIHLKKKQIASDANRIK